MRSCDHDNSRWLQQYVYMQVRGCEYQLWFLALHSIMEECVPKITLLMISRRRMDVQKPV